jgi:hypothetical protein
MLKFDNLIWLASVAGMSYVANHVYGWDGSLFVYCAVCYHIVSKDYKP